MLSHLRDVLQLDQHALDWPSRILLVHARSSVPRHNPDVLGVSCMEDVKQLWESGWAVEFWAAQADPQ